MQDTLRNSDLRTLASTLKNQNMRKHDVIVPASRIRMLEDATVTINDVPLPDPLHDMLVDEGVMPSVMPDGDGPARADLPYKLIDIAHADFASKLGIPKKYYDRMQEEKPDLLAENVNTWLQEAGKNYLIRTFRPEDEGSGGRGILRSLLSDRYFIMDNIDLLFRALKTVKNMGIEAEVKGCNLTHSRMYVNFVIPSVRINANDLIGPYHNPRTRGRDVTMTAGFVLSNSEVGRGSQQITPRPILNVCSNAVTWKPDELRRVHLGGKLEEGVIRWSDDTKVKAMELADAQVRDAVETFATEDYLEGLVQRMLEKAGADQELEHPHEAVRNASSHIGLTEDEQEDVLNHFTRGGDTRRMGLVNALTFHAQEVDDADKQYEVEAATHTLLQRMDEFDVRPEQQN